MNANGRTVGNMLTVCGRYICGRSNHHQVRAEYPCVTLGYPALIDELGTRQIYKGWVLNYTNRYSSGLVDYPSTLSSTQVHSQVPKWVLEYLSGSWVPKPQLSTPRGSWVPKNLFEYPSGSWVSKYHIWVAQLSSGYSLW
jgi:hypothetical protein